MWLEGPETIALALFLHFSSLFRILGLRSEFGSARLIAKMNLYMRSTHNDNEQRKV